MNFIKKIFDKNIDEDVHLQFQKFGKGEFKDRAIIKAKESKGKYTISTTSEFAREFVKETAIKLGDEKTLVKGVIVSTLSLDDELEFINKKQFMGVKQYVIEKEMSGREILELLEKFPKVFFALSFSAKKDDTVLKIKAKAPKSAKPSSKGDEKPNPDFCRIVTRDKKIGESFVFEKPDFKNAEISHDFIITGLIIPESVKGEKDFSKIREMAKRKGKVIRKAEIDGQEIVKESEFEA